MPSSLLELGEEFMFSETFEFGKQRGIVDEYFEHASSQGANSCSSEDILTCNPAPGSFQFHLRGEVRITVGSKYLSEDVSNVFRSPQLTHTATLSS